MFAKLYEGQELIEKVGLDFRLKVSIRMGFSKPFRKRLRTDKELYEKIRKNFVENHTTLLDLKNQRTVIENHDTRDSLHNILQPTLILVGDDDRVISIKWSQLLHEKIPNSKLKIIKDTGHNFLPEEPDKVNNIIWEFIKENL